MTQYVIRRQAQRPVYCYGRTWADGERYYSHTVGSTVYWTAAPWHAALFGSEEEARQSPGWSWQCEVLRLEEATAEDGDTDEDETEFTVEDSWPQVGGGVGYLVSGPGGVEITVDEDEDGNRSGAVLSGHSDDEEDLLRGAWDAVKSSDDE